MIQYDLLTAKVLSALQAQLQFETSGRLWPEPGDLLQEHKVRTPHRHLLLLQTLYVNLAMLQVGRATLTSHRLLWTDTTASPEQGSSCQVPLSAVHEVLLKASMMLRSPKIRVFVYVDEHSKPAVGMLDVLAFQAATTS